MLFSSTLLFIINQISTTISITTRTSNIHRNMLNALKITDILFTPILLTFTINIKSIKELHQEADRRKIYGENIE